MKPTVSRRSGAHVENSPPPEKLNFNPQLLARILLFLKNNKTKGGPPLFEERYTAFVNLLY